jgi:molybdenum cofactor cytidylyltransferase
MSSSDNTKLNKMATISSLIISAGFSARMKEFKPLKKYADLPFIINIITKLSTISTEIFIVTGYRGEDIQGEVNRWLQREPRDSWLEPPLFSRKDWHSIQDRVYYVHNSDYKKGMFGSLQRGLEHLQSASWILYHFVDQPNIPFSFYTDFAAQSDESFNWIQPRFEGKNGHPLLFHQEIIPLILNEPVSGNLKKVSRSKEIYKKFWDCKYPQILQDFDTPSDLLTEEY